MELLTCVNTCQCKGGFRRAQITTEKSSQLDHSDRKIFFIFFQMVRLKAFFSTDFCPCEQGLNELCVIDSERKQSNLTTKRIFSNAKQLIISFKKLPQVGVVVRVLNQEQPISHFQKAKFEILPQLIILAIPFLSWSFWKLHP